MSGQMVSQPLGAIGSYGMNTQTTPIDLAPQFATLALNCYADEAGRPTARKSAMDITTDNSSVGDADQVRRIYRHNLADGTSQVISSTPGYVVRGTTTFTVILTNTSTGNYQFASLNGRLYGCCVSEVFTSWLETTWASSTVTTPANPIAIHSAYGRLWALQGTTLYWSDLLDGTNFTTGASGSLNLQRTHTQYTDVPVAITSFNGMIVVLNRNSTTVLGLAADKNPNNTTAPIYLRDFVPHIGCVARDTVVSTGDDVLFLSDDGVRSLARSMAEQQGPAPLTDVSQLNKNYVVGNLVRGNDTLQLTACWNPEKSWYMVFAADTLEVWIFDLGQRVPQTQLPRLFIWRTGTTRKLFHGVFASNEVMYYAGIGALYDMENFDVTDTYTMSITTGWLSMGGPERLDMYKRVMVSLTGGSGQTASVKWYVDFLQTSERVTTFTLDNGQTVYEYNVDEYEIAEYGGGASTTAEEYLNIGGAGKVIQFALEIPVLGYSITLNNMIAFFKQGRVR